MGPYRNVRLVWLASVVSMSLVALPALAGNKNKPGWEPLPAPTGLSCSNPVGDPTHPNPAIQVQWDEMPEATKYALAVLATYDANGDGTPDAEVVHEFGVPAGADPEVFSVDFRDLMTQVCAGETCAMVEPLWASARVKSLAPPSMGKDKDQNNTFTEFCDAVINGAGGDRNTKTLDLFAAVGGPKVGTVRITIDPFAPDNGEVSLHFQFDPPIMGEPYGVVREEPPLSTPQTWVLMHMTEDPFMIDLFPDPLNGVTWPTLSDNDRDASVIDGSFDFYGDAGFIDPSFQPCTVDALYYLIYVVYVDGDGIQRTLFVEDPATAFREGIVPINVWYKNDTYGPDCAAP